MMKRLVIAVLTAITVTFAGLAAAAESREAAPQATASPTQITICHKTGSDANPWRRITVSSRAVSNPNSRSGKLLRGHLRHTGDAVVVGTASCPSPTVTPSPTSTPPTKITICHKTGSATNPYRRITVSSRAVTNPTSSSGTVLRGHMRHAGDLLLPGATACPSSAAENRGVRLTANLQPVTGATGSGSATVTIRVGQSTLCASLTVTGVANVTAAHIHRVSTGAIAVPLTAPITGKSSGCTTVEKAVLRQIVANPGAFYVNVHSATYPDGQVQGNLSR
jgi:hypothetical protein